MNHYNQSNATTPPVPDMSVNRKMLWINRLYTYILYRLRNGIYCVGWGVKLYACTHSLL